MAVMQMPSFERATNVVVLSSLEAPNAVDHVPTEASSLLEGGHEATLLVVANASVNHVTAEASSRLESGRIDNMGVQGHSLCGSSYRISIHGCSSSRIGCHLATPIRCGSSILDAHLPGGRYIQ